MEKRLHINRELQKCPRVIEHGGVFIVFKSHFVYIIDRRAFVVET